MIRLEQVKEARQQIADVVRVTPLLNSEQLSLRCGNDIYLKAEHLQKTGSFKIRGATNKVKQAVSAGAAYVTAASSGNHGQAVAYIAQRLGIPATIVVPEDAAQCKIDAIRSYRGRWRNTGTHRQKGSRGQRSSQRARTASTSPV